MYYVVKSLRMSYGNDVLTLESLEQSVSSCYKVVYFVRYVGIKGKGPYPVDKDRILLSTWSPVPGHGERDLRV